jgi:hypothetical protein
MSTHQSGDKAQESATATGWRGTIDTAFHFDILE